MITTLLIIAILVALPALGVLGFYLAHRNRPPWTASETVTCYGLFVAIGLVALCLDIVK